MANKERISLKHASGLLFVHDFSGIENQRICVNSVVYSIRAAILNILNIWWENYEQTIGDVSNSDDGVEKDDGDSAYKQNQWQSIRRAVTLTFLLIGLIWCIQIFQSNGKNLMKHKNCRRSTWIFGCVRPNTLSPKFDFLIFHLARWGSILFVQL